MMNEARIEHHVDDEARLRGGFTRKWGMNGEPDRLIFLPPLKGSRKGRMGLLECKRPGEEPTPLQARTLSVYRGMGFTADWASTFAQVAEFFALMDAQ